MHPPGRFAKPAAPTSVESSDSTPGSLTEGTPCSPHSPWPPLSRTRLGMASAFRSSSSSHFLFWLIIIALIISLVSRRRRPCGGHGGWGPTVATVTAAGLRRRPPVAPRSPSPSVSRRVTSTRRSTALVSRCCAPASRSRRCRRPSSPSSIASREGAAASVAALFVFRGGSARYSLFFRAGTRLKINQVATATTANTAKSVPHPKIGADI